MRGAGDHCPDNLFARSRKGPLSPVERRALEAHLGVCGLCRAAAALGALHGDVTELPSDDDIAVVARLAGRVVAPAGRGAGRARHVAIAAGVALMAMAGAAAAWRVARHAPAPEPPLVVAPAAPLGAPALPSTRRTAPAAQAVASAAPAITSHRRRTPAVDHGPADAPEPAGPDELFARANAARGSGDLGAAASGYALLERQYPQSLEAIVSLVSAGDLLARQGQPAAALERFGRYLAASPGGSLAPEALFGRARCLRALGRPDDEAEAWRALLRTYPGSLYERTARRRLVALAADGSAP